MLNFDEKPYSSNSNDQNSNNNDQTLEEENPNEQSNDLNKSNSSSLTNSINKKKNRTLQFYKFLFYSLKTEIKLHDFTKMINTSNIGEFVIWIMSVILYSCSPKKFVIPLKDGTKTLKISGTLIWLHIFHILRSFLGIFLIWKLPRSSDFIQHLENYPDEKLSKTLFNDLIRESVLYKVVSIIKPRKILIYIYFALTVLNFILDLIDFFSVLATLKYADGNAKVVFLTFMLIAILYIVVDLSYIFWIGHLRYVFPPEYLRPINAFIYGMVDKIVTKFNLGKLKTNIIKEDKIQKTNLPYVKSSKMDNGGINILDVIMRESLGMYRDLRESVELNDRIMHKKDRENMSQGVDNNANAPNSNEQME